MSTATPNPAPGFGKYPGHSVATRPAHALALTRAGRYEAALAAHKALVQQERGPLRAAALYNLGNLHLRQALRHGPERAGEALPLVELAKQSYRDALRAEPGDWDARYNLERALSLALDYAKQRKQFGRPIADFQMVQSMLAEMYVWVESMRLFTYQTLRAANVISEEEGGRGEIHKLTAAGVMYVAETMNKVLNHAVQVHGGSGYIWESEINRLYRSIKLLEIGAGTTEVRKMIIAKELLSS